ncbi:hypothetical protein [Hydrogenophaga intermedia]|uniref:hypothetical protein n=1 Tax=Hydrogenophaga intermedia TaxID=65786 RepID=UPI002042F4AD|nr:hypothetical protein [Hydrogenophaga intermedia]MCM3566385.1 hypothetical protein [Hydrogenophaga intermedia]
MIKTEPALGTYGATEASGYSAGAWPKENAPDTDVRKTAWVFRTNVTGDFGIVTEDFGLS